MIMSEVPLTGSYRRAEVHQIFRRVKAGDSCMVVGVSGMAKSNLFRHLAKPEIRERFLGSAWQRYWFASTDVHALANLNEAGLYESILHALVKDARKLGLASDELSTAVQTQLVDLERLAAVGELPQAQRTFLAAMDLIASNGELHFVILLDQFDEIFPHLSARCFSTLRHLRDQFKYRLSYVVFTREDLSRLTQESSLEEFTELLTPAILWLGPYSREDAQFLLVRVAARYGSEFDREVSDCLIELSGGHPGLLKASCQAVIDGRVDIAADAGAASLLDDSNVRMECLKLWNSLSSAEQTALLKLAHGTKSVLPTVEMVENLKHKHLLVKAGKRDKLFSPIFASFLIRRGSGPVSNPSGQAARSSIGMPGIPKLQIDNEARSAWLDHHRLKLTPSEYKLLELLYRRRGSVCTRDEIIQYVYRGEMPLLSVGIDNSRVDTLVSRLRGKIKSVGGDPQVIATVWGQGFRLEND
jgi:hypothetical protein